MLRALAIILTGVFAASTACYADFSVSGNLVYLDEGIEIPPPMPAQSAKKYLRYRHQGTHAAANISEAPLTNRMLGLSEPTPGEHFYELRFSEEDEEVTVEVEFKSTNYTGSARDQLPKFANILLHIPVERRTNYQNALEKAESAIEDADDTSEIIDAFEVLSVELTEEPLYKYRGIKVLDELIANYALISPGTNLPTQFALYLDSLSDVAPIENFSLKRQFLLYKAFGFTLSDHYDLRQPIGGGRAVHDIASKLLSEALNLAFEADQEGSIERGLVADAVLRKAQVECQKVLMPARCADTIEAYFAAYPTFESRDIVSFLSTLGTAIEIESDIPNLSDGSAEGKTSRILGNTYLRGLWSRYYCIAAPVMPTVEASDLSDEAKQYTAELLNFSRAMTTDEGECSAPSI